MKRSLLLVIAAIMVLSVFLFAVSCGGKKSAETENADGTEASGNNGSEKDNKNTEEEVSLYGTWTAEKPFGTIMLYMIVSAGTENKEALESDEVNNSVTANFTLVLAEDGTAVMTLKTYVDEDNVKNAVKAYARSMYPDYTDAMIDALLSSGAIDSYKARMSIEKSFDCTFDGTEIKAKESPEQFSGTLVLEGKTLVFTASEELIDTSFAKMISPITFTK